VCYTTQIASLKRRLEEETRRRVLLEGQEGGGKHVEDSDYVKRLQAKVSSVVMVDPVDVFFF